MNESRKIFVQLGRLGDILNVLPIAYHECMATGTRPMFMVSRDFASVLDGVSYVEPVIFDGPFEQILKGAYEARKLTPNVIICQIYGLGLIAPQKCTSFARESWAQAGAPAPWGSLPLIIDRRDQAREEALIERVVDVHDTRPLVLLSLLGTSSPFPFGKRLFQYLNEHFGKSYQLVDISMVRAEKFYDLLGLFERAHLLITIDTGHQHLAAAVPDLPVVSLVTRDPSHWHGSPWRRQHLARIYYDEFPGMETKGGIVDWHEIFRGRMREEPRLIHAWADWREPGKNEDADRRHRVARESWAQEAAVANWMEAPFPERYATRTGRDIGDPHNLHFIRDMIDYAASNAPSREDILVVTNSDTCFAPGLSGRIIDMVRRLGCGFAHRMDFDRKLEKPFLFESHVRDGKFYPGTDLFFFPVWWWQRNRPYCGDYVAGREYWDEALRQLIKWLGGKGLEHAIYHERHPSFWEQADNRDVPGNAHNRAEREKWFALSGFIPNDFQYLSCIERASGH